MSQAEDEQKEKKSGRDEVLFDRGLNSRISTRTLRFQSVLGRDLRRSISVEAVGPKSDELGIEELKEGFSADGDREEVKMRSRRTENFWRDRNERPKVKSWDYKAAAPDFVCMKRGLFTS